MSAARAATALTILRLVWSCGSPAVNELDLHCGDRQGRQVAQAGVSSAEVIDGDTDALGLQDSQGGEGGVSHLEQCGFGQLKDQVGRVEIVVSQRDAHVVTEGGVLGLQR